jgi:hypothetical protein
LNSSVQRARVVFVMSFSLRELNHTARDAFYEGKFTCPLDRFLGILRLPTLGGAQQTAPEWQSPSAANLTASAKKAAMR